MSTKEQKDYWDGVAGIPSGSLSNEAGLRDGEAQRLAQRDAIESITNRPASRAAKPMPTAPERVTKSQPARAPSGTSAPATPAQEKIAGVIALLAAMVCGWMAFKASDNGWAALAAAAIAGYVASKLWQVILAVALIAGLVMIFGG